MGKRIRNSIKCKLQLSCPQNYFSFFAIHFATMLFWRSVLVLTFLILDVASPLTINDCPGQLPRDKYLQVYGDVCLQFITYRTRTFLEADEECGKSGGTLVHVKDKNMNIYIVRQLLQTYQFQSQLWIGLSDIDTEGQFMWTDESPADFTNWGFAEGQGRRSNSDLEDCVTLDPIMGGYWKDQPCDRSVRYGMPRPFICQFQPQKSTPSPTEAPTTTPALTTSNFSGCPSFKCELDCGLNGYRTDGNNCSVCQCGE